MALKQDAKDKLKSIFKLDVDKLIAAAIATEEVDLVLPADVTVLTAAELTTRDEVKKTEGKREGETVGETKGKEIIVKKIAKKMGLDETIVGTDVDKLEAEVTKKFKAGDAGLQEQVTALLKDKEVLTAEVASAKTSAAAATFEASLISMFPANRTADLKDGERLLLLKNELQFETVDGKTVVKRGGVVVADPNTHAPLPIEKVLTDIFAERKWTGAAEQEGGRGGGNSGGGGTAGVKTLSGFTEKWTAENPGKNSVSPDFDAALAAHTKVNTDFNFDV